MKDSSTLFKLVDLLNVYGTMVENYAGVAVSECLGVLFVEG